MPTSTALLPVLRCRSSLGAAWEAAQLDPERPKYWARMGDAHSRLGQAALALLCYQQAAAMAPEDVEIAQGGRGWRHLGLTQQAKGSLPESWMPCLMAQPDSAVSVSC